MAENTAFIEDLSAVVRKHYPDGQMKADDITVYFGMVIASALASQPEPVRDRAARVLAHMVKHPAKSLRDLI